MSAPEGGAGGRGGLRADLAVLASLLRGQSRRGTHAERLEAFYAPQAERYDAFRERLLAGRGELLRALAGLLPDGARVVELGCGTGRNIEYFGADLARFAEVHLVDLCEPLLALARRRAEAHPQMRVVHADATTWQPPALVDAVYCSYSLTMIPDWAGAIENARRMLRPGGVMAVVDFYVSSPRPPAGHVRHGAFDRAFWPRWFGHDGVRLDPERLARLEERFACIELTEARTQVPYLLGLSVPHYRFLGRRPEGE